MSIQLSRPLATMDLEATGVQVGKDRIVEICIHKTYPDNSSEIYTKRVNPEIPIPLEVSEIHGIYDSDIIDAPKFGDIADEILEFLNETDLAGFNSNKFDVPMLVEEFYRVGKEFPMENRKLIDVQNIFHKMEERTLAAAYKFYCGKDLENAHSAEADTMATYEVLLAQLEKYSDLGKDVDSLHAFSQRYKHLDFMGRITENKTGDACFNFGKYKGQKVTEVLKKDPAYYGWMMNGDFPHYTKKVLTDIKNSME